MGTPQSRKDINNGRRPLAKEDEFSVASAKENGDEGCPAKKGTVWELRKVERS